MELSLRQTVLLVVAVVVGLILLPGLSGWFVIFAAFGTLLLVFGVMPLRVYIRIARSTPVDVADVSAGMKEIALTGTARPAGATTTSALTGEESLVSRSKVYSPGGDGSNWVEVENAERYEPFILDDGTGEIFVDPNGAMWSFETETWTVDGEKEPPRPIREFLEERDSSLNAVSEVVHERDRKFEESRLDPDEDVFVYGTPKEGPAEDAPLGAVTPYIGIDRGDQADGSYGKNSLSWSLLSSVKGDPNDSELFVVADSRRRGAPRRFLSRGAFVSAVGLALILIGVGIQLGVLERVPRNFSVAISLVA